MAIFLTRAFFPGKYMAKIDRGQLEKLHLIAVRGSTDFTILRSIDGTLISNLLFNISPSTTYKRAPK
jgi:hypothetical protein